MVTWIPLDEAGITFTIQPGELDAGSATVSGSTLSFSGASNAPSHPYAYMLWSLTLSGMPADTSGLIRVVCTNASFGSYSVPGAPWVNPGVNTVFSPEPDAFTLDTSISTTFDGNADLVWMQWPGPGSATDFSGANLDFEFYLRSDFFDDGGPGPVDPGADAQAEVFVHTLNAGRGKWSRYLFPFQIDAFSQLGGELLIRAGDTVVKVKEGLLTDHVDGSDVGFSGAVQWPWIDAGQPGVTKQMIGFDLVAAGEPSVSFGFDQADLARFTDPYPIPADTMTGGIIPMPLMAPSVSLRLDFAAGSAWNVRSATIYLNDGKWQP